MLKNLMKRIATLGTCATLLAAIPMSMDGCMDGLNGFGGLIGTTETVTTSTASASASGGTATASASSSSSTSGGGGIFGGLYGGSDCYDCSW